MVRLQRLDETIIRQQRTKRRGGPRKKDGAVGKYFGDAWSLAKRTAVGLNEIRKLINIETKIIQTTGTALTAGWAGAIYPISYIAQGTDYVNNRVGDSIKLQRVEGRMSFLKNASSTATNVRVMLIRDLDNVGAVPTITKIVDTVGSALAPLTPINYLYKEHYSVLYDELFTLNASGDNSHVVEFDMAHEGHIRYLDNTANPSGGGKGSMFLLVLPDDNVNQVSLAFFTRLYFTDD